MQNMQKHIEHAEYAEYDIPTDCARKELIHASIALDIELGEPPAIHGLNRLIRAQTESAARTSSHTFFPVAKCTGRAPSMQRMWPTA
jgi:hypothetical protein